MRKTIYSIILFALISGGFSKQAIAQGFDPAYVKVTLERAEKIVETLEVSDPDKGSKIKETIAKQYRDLSVIHDKRDKLLQLTREKQKDNLEKLEKERLKIARKTDKELAKLKKYFIQKLAGDLDEAQIIRVKDGMTYNVAPNTYQVYLKMLPDLTEVEKTYIWENLQEAREFAMTGSNSKEKHAWFGKYKGKINNYLSDQGHDLKKAGEKMEANLKNNK